jgi:hypothetical protein
MMNARTVNQAEFQLAQLSAARARLDARSAAIELELRQQRTASATAPAFVNVGSPPVSEAELDALAAQEGA